MSTAPRPGEPPAQTAKPTRSRSKTPAEVPSRIFLISYPKIVFLYPTLLVALAAAVYLSFVNGALDNANTEGIVLSVAFLAVLAVNMVVLTFDFPRTTSLTLFFLVVAVAMGATLLFVQKPELLPMVTETLTQFRPMANATFYWAFAAILWVLMLAAMIEARFDRWEARSNELLHREGIWGNLRRFPAQGVRIDKEINDVFEYMLLQSGRLILHLTNERRAIILDNVPFIKQKEETLTRMLGALEVEIRSEDESAEG